jgi:hypothetical protein
MFWKRLFLFFLPSPAALTLGWAALIISLLLSMTVAVITFSSPQTGNPAMLYGILAIPPAALILTIATIVERKPGARFFLWALVLGLALLAAVSLLVAGLLDPAIPFNGVVSLLSCCCLPFIGGLGLVLIFLGRKAAPAFRQALRAARLQRMVQVIQARGEALIPDLSAELSLGQAQVEKLVRELIADGELMAFLDVEYQRVYSAAALSEKQRRLLAMINTQGRAALGSLAGELNVSQDMLRQWIYSLAQRGQLHGFADWAEGVVYSQDVKQILAQNLCPHCGGKLDVAGKGLIQCEFCAAEMFL